MDRVHTNEHSERERTRINALETIKCEKCEVARGKPMVFVITRCSKCRQMGNGRESAFLCALLLGGLMKCPYLMKFYCGSP